MSQSSYDKFLVDLEKNIRVIALFESNGSETETLNVIKQAVGKTDLEALLNKFDDMSREGFDGRDKTAAEGGAPVSKSKKAAAAAAATTTLDVPADKKDGAARVRKKTGYNIFVAEKVADKKMNMTQAAGAWKALSDDDKKVYNQRAAALAAE